jgi:hypothetical protein
MENLYNGTPASELTDNEKSEVIFVLTRDGYPIEQLWEKLQ